MNETEVSLLKKIKQTLFLPSSIFFLKRKGCQIVKKFQSKHVIDSLFDRFSAQFCFELDLAKWYNLGEFIGATIWFEIDIFISYKPLVCVKTVSNLGYNLFWIIDRFIWIFNNHCVLATNVLYNTDLTASVQH